MRLLPFSLFLLVFLPGRLIRIIIKIDLAGREKKETGRRDEEEVRMRRFTQTDLSEFGATLINVLKYGCILLNCGKCILCNYIFFHFEMGA